jgi:alkanesulfonate monooxygenase SsuD/methylene tetrahydromethanopterin reductase-like flavin-dependent oxidoreductase (luciferase family)
MRFALELSGAGASANPRLLGELAHIAEDVGWDGVFLEDYIVNHAGSDIPTCDPWVSLAAIATRTTRVRIGTEVTPLATPAPVEACP